MEEVIKGERVGFIDVQILPTPHAICEGIMNDTYTIRWAQVVESEKAQLLSLYTAPKSTKSVFEVHASLVRNLKRE